MEKNIGMDEDVRLSHSDAINNITAVFSEKDKITFRDKFYHESHLLINEMQGIINSVRLGSDVGKIEKTINNGKIFINFANIIFAYLIN